VCNMAKGSLCHDVKDTIGGAVAVMTRNDVHVIYRYFERVGRRIHIRD
jgi:hypothetical protein